MPIDVDLIRSQTPGVAAGVVHFNNAGASLPPAAVLTATTEYLEAEARTGGYEIAADRAEDLEDVYHGAVALFGGKRENWAFVESATRAWNAAFSSLRFKPGERVITTKAEYPSNMAGLLRAAEIQGIDVVVAPDDEHGQVDVAALEGLMDHRTRLVSVTHVPTQGGLINPAEAVGALLRNTDVLYQVDACQSAGQLPVNVETIGCDILSFTGRKFLRGPRGTGMVWANDRALTQMGNPAGVDMQGASWPTAMEIVPNPDAGRFEPYEVFYAGKVGLAVALRYAVDLGIDNIVERNQQVSAGLRSGLEELPGVTLHDKGLHKSAIVTFSVADRNPVAVRDHLRSNRINVSVTTEESATLDFAERGLSSIIRASAHYYNDDSDIDKLVSAVAELTER